jgi:hypothetical protein
VQAVRAAAADHDEIPDFKDGVMPPRGLDEINVLASWACAGGRDTITIGEFSPHRSRHSIS